MTVGASPLAGINKLPCVRSSREVILTWLSLFVLFPPQLYPITVFAWCWCPLIQHSTRLFCIRGCLVMSDTDYCLHIGKVYSFQMWQHSCHMSVPLIQNITHTITGLKYRKDQSQVDVILSFIWRADKYFSYQYNKLRFLPQIFQF